MANKKVIDEIVEDDIIEEVPVEEEIVEEISIEEPKKDVKELVAGRGFNSYKEAVEFAQTEAFKRLHPLDQEEFNSWLKSLK